MKNIKNYLKFLSEEKIDEKFTGKLQLAVKSYLARACCSVRNPQVIQMNHYVDEVYAADKPDNKNIVLSPSRVPFPIAAFANMFLVAKDGCPLFFINGKGQIEIHPLEYVIPVFVALFSGDNSRCGSSFVASVVLCGEIAMKLIETAKLPNYQSICVSMVIVIGHLWDLSAESIGHVVDNIPVGRDDVSIQTCLQAISMARCKPDWFVDEYRVADSTGAILAFLDQTTAPDDRRNFPGLDCLQFALIGLSPLGSLLAKLFYSCPISSADHVKVTIPSTLWNTNKPINNRECSVEELENVLSALIGWKGSLDTDCPAELLKHSVSEQKSEHVSINVAAANESVISIHINGNVRNVPFSQAALVAIPLKRLLVPQIIWDLHVVLGVCVTGIVLDGIDSLLTQPSLTTALSHVFERPGLD